MALSRPPQALLLRALGLGDLLTAVPALRGVRRALASHQIMLATDPELTDLVGLTGAIDGVIPARGLDSIRWDRPAPDVAVNLHGRGPQSHLLLSHLSPDRLVAFDCLPAGVAGPAWRPDEHEVRRWCRLVEDGLNAPADPGDLHLPVPREAWISNDRDDHVTLVHPGAANAARRWPSERFATVAVWLARRGLRVLITGAGHEKALAARVAEDAGLDADADVAGQTSLRQLAHLVAHSRLIVCGDTGIAHLASAFATPSIVLFGPTPPSRWGPPESGPHVAIYHGHKPGNPHDTAPDPALLSISTHEVLAAAEELLPRTQGFRLASSHPSGVARRR